MITGIRMRYVKEGSDCIIYKDISFYDLTGDAIAVDWELISILNSDITVTIKDGTINQSANAQISGSTVTGTARYSEGAIGAVIEMSVTITDGQGNRSNTMFFQEVINNDCSN